MLATSTYLIGGGHNSHDILVRLKGVAVGATAVLEGVKAAADILATDLADLAAEGDLVDLVGKVVVVGLHVHRVGRQVEVSRYLKAGVYKVLRIIKSSFGNLFLRRNK